MSERLTVDELPWRVLTDKALAEGREIAEAWPDGRLSERAEDRLRDRVLSWAEDHLPNALRELQAARAELALLRPVAEAAVELVATEWVGPMAGSARHRFHEAACALRASGWQAPGEGEVGSG